MPIPRIALALIGLICVPQLAAAQVVRCELYVDTYGLRGVCAPPEGPPREELGSRELLALQWPVGPVRVVVASGPAEPPPWRGAFLLPTQEINFEIVREQEGTPGERIVLRSSMAWVTVREWRETRPMGIAAYGGAELVFDLAEYPKAGPDDIAILEAAIGAFDTLRAWDREDDRNCGNDAAEKTGLFCLLAHAVEARMGRYHHRQPALELMRRVILERWSDRLAGHALMDFNHHSATTLGDLRSALEAALVLATTEAGPER